MSQTKQVTCPICHRVNRILTERPARGARCGACREPLFPGKPIALDESNFDAHLAGTEVPLVMDFWAPWCGPCRAMAPAFERAATDLEPRARFAKVDTENSPGLGARYGIRSIPTTVVFRGGQEVARISGALDHPGLVRWISPHLGST